MDASNLSTPFMGDYVRRLQRQVNTLQTTFDGTFTTDGTLLAQGEFKMNGNNINGAGEITVGVLNYTSLNPPVSSGGNIAGPLSSTDNALVRYDGTTGQIVQNSAATLADDGKLAVAGNVLDMSAAGTINMQATNVRANGAALVTSQSISAIDADITIMDGTSGRVIRSSGVPISTIALKLPLAGGTMTGNINMDGRDITNIATIAGSVNTSIVDDIVTSASGPVANGDIAIFDGTSGRAIQGSGIQVSTINSKVNQSGDTMTGNLSLGGNNLLAVNTIAGTVKTSAVNSLVTSTAASAIDSDIVIFDSTTGKVVKSSGVAVSAIAAKLPLAGGTMTGAIAMGTNNITNIGSISGATKTSAADSIVTSTASSVADSNLVAFDSTTGKIVKDSGVATATISNKVNRSGDTMTGSLNMGTNNITNVGILSGSVKAMNPNNIVTSAAGIVTDSNIVIFDLTSGNIVKDSGIAVSTIANKVNRSGDIMTGDLSFDAHNITDVSSISGATKTSAVDDIVTSTASGVTDSDIAVFDSTTGKIVKTSGVAVSAIATKLPLAGGTMSGPIDMATNNITGIGLIIGDGGVSRDADNIVSNAGTSVSGNLAVFSGTTGKVIIDSGTSLSQYLPLAGGTMTGAIAMGTNNITNIGSISGATKTSIVDSIVTSTASSVTDSDIVVFDATTGKVVKSSGVAASTITEKVNRSGDTMTGDLNLGTHDLANIGALSGATHSRAADDIVSHSSASVSGNVAIFSGTTGRILADSGASLSQYLPLAGGTMTGAIAMGTNNITNVGTLSGAAHSRSADNIVSNAGASVDARIAIFSGTSGKVITDSGASLSQYLPLAGGTMTGAIAMNGNNITNVATLSGATHSRSADNIVSNAGTSVSGNVAIFSGVTGKIVTDSGTSLSQYLLLAGGTMTGSIAMGTNNITNVGLLSGATHSRAADDIVSHSSTSVSGNVAIFSGTTGRILADSGASLSQYLPLAGGTMTGAIAMGTNNITNVGTLSGATNSRSADNIISCATAGVSGNVPTFTGVSKVIQDSGTALSSLATTAALAAYLPLAGGTMAGAIAMGANNITNIGTLSGATHSRSADNIVSNVGASVDARVAIFSGTSGKVITDGGTTLSQYALLSGATFTGAIAMGTNNITNVGTLSGATNSRSANDIVSNTGASVDGRIAIFSGTSGKVITDGGTTLSQYALLSGATFTGAIAMGTNNITNIGSISGATKTSVVDDIVTSTASGVTDSDIVVFNSTTGKIVKTSGVAVSAIATKLPLAGGTMSGAIAMGTNDITNVGTLSGATNSRSADNIVSNAGVSVDARVAIFSGTSGKVITDSGATLSQYLPLAGGTMSGSINTGGFPITTDGNARILYGNNITVSGVDGVALGKNTTIASDRAIAIGSSAAVSGADCICVGANTSITTGASSTVVGAGSSAAGAGISIFGAECDAVANSVIFGDHSSTAATGGVIFGQNISTTAAGAIAIGRNITNSTTNTAFIGTGALTSIRSDTNCDLGSTSAPFRSVIVNTGIDSTGGLAVGGTNATSVTIGRSGITTLVNGTFACTQPTATWYSSTAYNPSFTAGTARLVPPTGAVAGIISEFTHFGGVLTYTGTRSRFFKVDVDISYLQGASGASMRWFVSRNGSLSIGAQTSIFYQTNATNSSTRICVHLSDIVALLNTNTLQLAAVCSALSSAVSIENVTFSVMGFVN